MSPSFSSPTASHAVTLVFNGRSALAALILRDSRVTTLSCSSIWSEARVRMCWCMSQAALLYSLSPRRCLRKLDVHIAHNHTTLTLPPLCMGQHDGKGIHRREERGQWRGKEARTPEPEPFKYLFWPSISGAKDDKQVQIEHAYPSCQVFAVHLLPGEPQVFDILRCYVHFCLYVLPQGTANNVYLLRQYPNYRLGAKT